MVHIIIVNYNTWTDTRDCLYSLLDSSFTDWQVIVVDNGSNDSSLPEIKKSLSKSDDVSLEKIPIYTVASDIKDSRSKVILLQSSENLGFAGANNLVLEQLLNKDGYVWMLNPDMIVDKETLENLHTCAALKSENNIVWGMTIKSFVNRNEIEIIGGGRVNGFSGTVTMIKDYDAVGELDYINGSSLFTSIETFRKVGLFDEKYFLYWEETDWCFRAKKRNISFNVCREAIGFDKGATSIGRGFLSDYYYGRNSLIFLKRHFTRFHIYTALSVSVFRIVYRILRGRIDKARGYLYGVLDYLRGKEGKI